MTTTATTGKTRQAGSQKRKPEGISLLASLCLFGLLSSLETACVSLAPRSLDASRDARVIDSVPARRWAENRCAAGALSEVLNHFGDSVTERKLSESLTRARGGGVVTVDLLIAARNRGFDAQLVRGDASAVQQELKRNHPLILMLRVMDAPGHEKDLFHYVVLSGIDPARGLVRMHFGDGKKRWVALPRFAGAWAAAGNAMFVIGPRQRMPATEDDLRRAVVLEESGELSRAIALYAYFLESHPDSVGGWTNLGNARAAAGEVDLAEAAYRNALFLDRNDRDALNNLAWLLLQQRRLEEAEEFARRAVAVPTADSHLAIDTLARVLAARGNCREALAILEESSRLPDESARKFLEAAGASIRRMCGAG